MTKSTYRPPGGAEFLFRFTCYFYNVHVLIVQQANSIQSTRDEVNALLTGLKARGKRICAYGAPAKATTLMYHFGIDKNLIEYIVDDNP